MTGERTPSPLECERCFDTGWAHVPHSDESREICDCPAARRMAAGYGFGWPEDQAISTPPQGASQ